MSLDPEKRSSDWSHEELQKRYDDLFEAYLALMDPSSEDQSLTQDTVIYHLHDRVDRANSDSGGGTQDLVVQLLSEIDYLTARVKFLEESEAREAAANDQIRIMGDEIKRLEGRLAQRTVSYQDETTQGKSNSACDALSSPLNPALSGISALEGAEVQDAMEASEPGQPQRARTGDANVSLEPSNHTAELEQASDTTKPEHQQSISPDDTEKVLKPIDRVGKSKQTDNELNECNEERQKLTREVQSQRRSIERMQDEISKLDGALEDTNNQKLEWENSYGRLQSERISDNQDWLERYEVLKHQYSELRAEHDKLPAKTSEPPGDAEEGLLSRCAERCKDLEQQRNAEAELSKRDLGICDADWQQKYDDLKKAFASLKRTHSTCAVKSSGPSCGDDADETCEEKYGKLLEEYNTLSVDYDTLKSRTNVYELDNKLEHALEERESFKNDRDHWRSEYHALLDEREPDNTKPNANRSVIPTDLEDIQATLATALKSRDDWEAEHARAVVDRDEWESKYNEANSEREAAINELEDQFLGLEEKLQHAERECQGLKGNVAVLDGNCEKMNRAWAFKHQALVETHKQSEEKNKNLEEKNNALENDYNALLDKVSDIDIGERNCDNLEHEYTELNRTWTAKYAALDKKWAEKCRALDMKFLSLVGTTVQDPEKDKKEKREATERACDELDEVWWAKYTKLVERYVETAKMWQLRHDVLVARMTLMEEAEAKRKAGEVKEGGANNSEGSGEENAEASKKKCKEWEAKHAEAEEKYGVLVSEWANLKWHNIMLMDDKYLLEGEIMPAYRHLVDVEEKFERLVDALMHSVRKE